MENNSSIVFSLSSKEPEKIKMDATLTLTKNKPVIIAGHNATLKSIVAKAILYKLYEICREEFEKYKELINIDEIIVFSSILNIEFNGKLECFKKSIALLLEDHRLIARYYIAFLRPYIERNLKSEVVFWINEIEDETKKEDALQELDKIIDEIRKKIFPLTNKLKILKTRAYMELISQNYSLLEEIKKKLANSIDIEPEELLPLEVDIYDDEYFIIDKRIDQEISSEYVSSSIASGIQFLALLYIFSIPVRQRFIVIEEPEETMSPPQQVLFMKFLETMIKNSEKKSENYVIITTHSPYIALSINSGNYYAYYDTKEKIFKIIQKEVPNSFIYADLLLAKTKELLG